MESASVNGPFKVAAFPLPQVLPTCGAGIAGAAAGLLVLLPEQEAHVEAEGGQEPDVEQHDHQEVPAARPPSR